MFGTKTSRFLHVMYSQSTDAKQIYKAPSIIINYDYMVRLEHSDLTNKLQNNIYNTVLYYNSILFYN